MKPSSNSDAARFVFPLSVWIRGLVFAADNRGWSIDPNSRVLYTN